MSELMEKVFFDRKEWVNDRPGETSYISGLGSIQYSGKGFIYVDATLKVAGCYKIVEFYTDNKDVSHDVERFRKMASFINEFADGLEKASAEAEVEEEKTKGAGEDEKSE